MLFALIFFHDNRNLLLSAKHSIGRRRTGMRPAPAGNVNVFNGYIVTYCNNNNQAGTPKKQAFHSTPFDKKDAASTGFDKIRQNRWPECRENSVQEKQHTWRLSDRTPCKPLQFDAANWNWPNNAENRDAAKTEFWRFQRSKIKTRFFEDWQKKVRSFSAIPECWPAAGSKNVGGRKFWHDKRLKIS